MNLKPTLIQDAIALEKLQKFLQANKLPHEDVKADGNIFIGYYDEAGNIIGSGGLELYATSALLRSLAVSQNHRGKNLGKKIVDDLLQTARDLDIQSIFLLTETAHDFFLRKGFVDISRENVPLPVKSSSEFAFVCPVSAACMLYSAESK